MCSWCFVKAKHTHNFRRPHTQYKLRIGKYLSLYIEHSVIQPVFLVERHELPVWCSWGAACTNTSHFSRNRSSWLIFTHRMTSFILRQANCSFGSMWRSTYWILRKPGISVYVTCLRTKLAVKSCGWRKQKKEETLWPDLMKHWWSFMYGFTCMNVKDLLLHYFVQSSTKGSI